MKAVILTFHAVHRENCYAENDHIALDDALRELSEQGIPVRPLHELVSALANPFARWRLPSRFVALTCDDGELGEVETMLDTDGNPSVSFAELQRKYVLAQKNARGGGHHISPAL